MCVSYSGLRTSRGYEDGTSHASVRMCRAWGHEGRLVSLNSKPPFSLV